MKKTAVAILICLIIVLTIGMVGCSQGVEAIFGEQKTVSYNLKEITNFNLGSNAQIGEIDTFGMAVCTYVSQNNGNTYYSLYNFDTAKMIINDSILPIGKICDGLYAQMNQEFKVNLYGASGQVAKELKGVPSEDSFYDEDNQITYYVGLNGKVQKSNKVFEEINKYGDAYSYGGNYLVEVVGGEESWGLKFFDKQGEYVGQLLPYLDFNLSADVAMNGSWMIGDKIFFQYINVSTSEDDYDVLYDGEKCDLTTYCYDIKSGNSKEVKFEYMAQGTGYPFDESAIFLVSKIVDKHMSVPYVQAFGVDLLGNLTVKLDLQKLLKGAIDFEIEEGADGKAQLVLKNNIETCVFEGKECVAQFPNSIGARIEQDTVTIGGKIYDFSGKLIIDTAQVTGYRFTPNGKIIYTVYDQNDGTNKCYIYDIVTKKRTEQATAGDSEVFIEEGYDYFKIDQQVVFYTNPKTPINNVDNIAKIGSYYTEEYAKKVYKVTYANGNVGYFMYTMQYSK